MCQTAGQSTRSSHSAEPSGALALRVLSFCDPSPKLSASSCCCGCPPDGPETCLNDFFQVGRRVAVDYAPGNANVAQAGAVKERWGAAGRAVTIRQTVT